MSVLASVALFAAEEGATEFHAENTWLPESSEILWGTIAFLIVLFLLIKFAAKPIGASLQGRTERIANEIESAAKARTDAEAEVARVRQNLADVDTERTRILAEADRDGRAHAGRRHRPQRRRGRRPGSPGRRRHRRPSAAAPAASCRPRWRRGPARPRSASWWPASTTPPRSGSIEDYIAKVGARHDRRHRIDGYASALFEIAKAEGNLDEVEDELFRFARSLEGSDELRNALTDETGPGRAPPGHRGGPARPQGVAHDRRLSSASSSAPAGPRTCPPSSPSSSSGPPPRRTARSPRCARPSRSPPTSSAGSPPPSPTPPASRSR